MLRVVLQRFAVQRSIAKQLEAIPLDEVLRRMQSSSLTNPARSLDSHFVLADAATTASASSAESPSSADPTAHHVRHSNALRSALSERLLSEARRATTASPLSLDAGSLMLSNCLRHQLSPLATQQMFALWLRCMLQSAQPGGSRGTTGAGSRSVLGLGRSSGGSSGQDAQLMQFQSLVRVMEACLDAYEQSQPVSQADGHMPHGAVGPSTGVGADAAPAAATALGLTLDDWAELVDTVEQFAPFFTDHGASTVSLLVQFSSLALVLSGEASDTPAAAAAEAEGRIASGLRRLGHLQTDRTLLQRRVFGLCAESVRLLCDLESSAGDEGDEEEEPRSTAFRRASPWWHRPQELVRLSHARRRIEWYESQQLERPSASVNTHTAESYKGSTGRTGDGGSAAFASSTAGHYKGPASSSSSPALRGTRVGGGPHSARTQTSALAATAATSRWLPRLPSTWWSSAASLAGSAAAGMSSGASPRVGRQLGGYVTYQALRHTPASTTYGSQELGESVSSPDSPSRSGRGRSTTTAAPFAAAAALSVPLEDVYEIFATVCATATSGDALSHVTAFSWWVSDVVRQRHGRRSLHSLRDAASLLGIAELCVAYPDGTQTVVAEILKCLQLSPRLLWHAGDGGVTGGAITSEQLSVSMACALWPRACEVVANTLPLTTVRAEADRTLRVLVTTAQQAGSSSSQQPYSPSAVKFPLLRQRRRGLLVLACLLLQRPNGFVTPLLAAQLQELTLTVPFAQHTESSTELASAVRALYVFTHANYPLRDDKHAEAVSCVLHALSLLLTPSPTTRREAEPHESRPGGLSPSLSALSSVERQLLRSALREVRQWTPPAAVATTAAAAAATAAAAVTAPHEPHATSRQHESSTQPGGGSVPQDGEDAAHLSVTAPHPSRKATHDSPLDRSPAAQPRAARDSFRPRTESAQRLAAEDSHRQASEERLLQREIEAVSRRLSQRRSIL